MQYHIILLLAIFYRIACVRWVSARTQVVLLVFHVYLASIAASAATLPIEFICIFLRSKRESSPSNYLSHFIHTLESHLRTISMVRFLCVILQQYFFSVVFVLRFFHFDSFLFPLRIYLYFVRLCVSQIAGQNGDCKCLSTVFSRFPYRESQTTNKLELTSTFPLEPFNCC